MRLKDINAVDLYHSWILNSGYFECFVRTGPFTTLQHYKDFELEEYVISKDKPSAVTTNTLYEEILETIKRYDLKNTLFILDLPDSICITAGAYLNNAAAVKPILVCNFLLHDYGLVGSQSFVNALASCGLDLKENIPQGYAFILDYNRFNDFTEEDLLKGFNNQYEISDEEVPDSDMLKELGYETVVYISFGEVKEDMKYYLEYLENESISVIKYNLKR